MKKNILLTATLLLAAIGATEAQIDLGNARTPEAIIGIVPEMPGAATLAAYVNAWNKSDAPHEAVRQFADKIHNVRERYDEVIAMDQAEAQAEIRQGASRQVRRQTGRSLEEVESMSDSELDAMGRGIANQMSVGGMSLSELQALASKMEGMSDEEKVAYMQNSGAMAKVTNNVDASMANARQGQSLQKNQGEMQKILDQWRYIDGVYEKERKVTIDLIRRTQQKHEAGYPKPVKDKIVGEYYTKEQEEVLARLTLACDTELYTIWRNFISKRQGILKTRLTDCIRMDELQQKQMKAGGMTTDYRSYAWETAKAYIDITSEVTGLPEM